jgi:hypothetical protein
MRGMSVEPDDQLSVVDQDESQDAFLERLTPEEQADLEEAEPDALTITYSGQDFDINGLVRRLTNEDILIPTFGHEDDRIGAAGFQRSFVWSRSQMDRFIESLLLGYPIPGIFLVRQADRRYLVLDGQQRLRTLEYFYRGIYGGREFALENVADRFRGLTYKRLPDEQRRLIDDAFIQATIVATDGSSESLEAIYQIFERLNSGGTQLTPHEIRVALYAGPFIDFLEKLNQDTNWRALYGRVSPRLRDQEVILRVLALYTNAATYRRPLKAFLNNYVAAHRDLDGVAADQIRTRFTTASALIAEAAGRDALRPQGSQVNSALTEALFVGLMRRLDQGTTPSAAAVASAIAAASGDPRMQGVISRATADEESVRTRLEVAIGNFARA